jgi:hypothetical protein
MNLHSLIEKLEELKLKEKELELNCIGKIVLMKEIISPTAVDFSRGWMTVENYRLV